MGAFSRSGCCHGCCQAQHRGTSGGYAADFERAITALTEADRTMGRLFGAPAADLTVTPTRVA